MDAGVFTKGSEVFSASRVVWREGVRLPRGPAVARLKSFVSFMSSLSSPSFLQFDLTSWPALRLAVASPVRPPSLTSYAFPIPTRLPFPFPAVSKCAGPGPVQLSAFAPRPAIAIAVLLQRSVAVGSPRM